jgi:hypothetical protein
MDKTNHKDITRSAVALIADYSLVQALVEKSCIGDLGTSKHISAAHYDNCCWEEAKQWIVKHRSAAVDAAYRYYSTGKKSDFNSACKSLGYVIHTTEDFYAHSNWIENSNWGEIADFEGERPASWYSAYSRSCIPDNSTPGIPLHEDMHKDHPSRPGYYKAFGDAVFAVRDQVKRFQQSVKSRYPQKGNDILSKLGFRNIPSTFIDAAVNWPDKKVYFFRGSKYYRYDLARDKVDDGYPKSICGNWRGLEPFSDGIDAVIVKPDGTKAYFFSGNNYIRYDIKKRMADQGYPLPVKRKWFGLEPFSSGMDAAFTLPESNSAYFFKGDLYVRYDMLLNRACDGYPRKITGDWKGLEAFESVDAAFSMIDDKGNIKVYFFKGDQYLRYQYIKIDNLNDIGCIDWDTMYNRVRGDLLSSDSIDSGYPKPISNNWHIIKP